MATRRQQLGERGEVYVARRRTCPRCKRHGTLKRLPTNFKCADIICDFCGYLAQVKTLTVKDVGVVPEMIIGAAWGPQKDRMAAGIFFPLFLVLVADDKMAIYYLSADLQDPHMFKKRKPLSPTARRAGWQGFRYDLKKLMDGAIVRLD